MSDKTQVSQQSVADLYTKRRDELLPLLEAAVRLDVPEPYASKLASARKKCRENQFEILLMGEFQGGKSTTFDILCDGRELSPRGIGIKTSAALISAQNISDGEERDGMKEWAEITCKTPVELYETISGLFQFDEAIVGKDGLPVPNLDDHTDVERLSESLERNAEKLIEASYENNDQVKIARLILKFYDTDARRALAQRTVLPIEEMQKLIVFPENWEMRTFDDFSFEEVRFLFIASVLLRIKSKNLERLGCRVTDCPGLFVNRYDTEVAIRQLSLADGIWYLVGGEKEIGESDSKILRGTITPIRAGRTVVSANIRQDQAQKIANVLPVTNGKVKGMGFQGVSPYNAYLALLAEQGEHILSAPDSFSASDIRSMGNAADREKYKKQCTASGKEFKADDFWCLLVRRCGMRTCLDELADVTALNTDSIALVRKCSLSEGILGPLEDIVVANKAYQILVNMGSELAAGALKKYEADLKVLEDTLVAEEEDWKVKKNAAKVKLAQTIVETLAVIDKSRLNDQRDVQSMSNYIAQELLNAVVTSQDFLSSCTNVLSSKAKELAHRLIPFGYEKELCATCEHAISAAYSATFSATLDEWIKNGTDMGNTFGTVIREMAACKSDVCEKWGDGTAADPMLRGLTLDVDFSMQNDDINRMAREIAMCSMPTITGVYSMFPVFGAMWNKIKEWIFGTDPWKKIYDSVKESVSRADFQGRLTLPVTERFKKYFNDYIKGMREVISSQADVFEKTRVTPVEEGFKKSQEEREDIAARNKALREGKIQPLREKLEQFKAAVEKEFRKA